MRPHLRSACLTPERRRRKLLPLTNRQRQILDHVATGFTNNQIARRLGVSESTVRKHLENIFARLEVSSRTAAVARVTLPLRQDPPDAGSGGNETSERAQGHDEDRPVLGVAPYLQHVGRQRERV